MWLRMKLGEDSQAIETLQTHELDVQNTTTLTALWLYPLLFAGMKFAPANSPRYLPEHSVFLSIWLVLTLFSSLMISFSSPYHKSQPHRLESIFSIQSSLVCSNYLI